MSAQLPTTSTDPGTPATAAPARSGFGDRVRSFVDHLLPLLLIRAAHPRQSVLTAVALGVAAALAGRPLREVGLVAGTVLVGQVLLGWHNDLVDREVDARHERTGKPVADGRLDPASVSFAIACGVLLLIPLALSNGLLAGAFYLVSVVVAGLGNIALRKGLLSFVPWAVGFALYPFFLSYAGWGGRFHGDPPEPAVVALCALVGLGVHVLVALWGLVADHEDGWTYLPVRLGLKLGANRLLAITAAYLVLTVGGLLLVAHTVGLSQ